MASLFGQVCRIFLIGHDRGLSRALSPPQQIIRSDHQARSLDQGVRVIRHHISNLAEFKLTYGGEMVFFNQWTRSLHLPV
jgi:hypothetical protein